MPTATLPIQDQVRLPDQPPAWLGDPAIDVLAVAIGSGIWCRDTGTYSLAFVNAGTGEQFNATISPARAMLWLDSMTFGLLSMDGRTVVSIDLVDGAIRTTPFQAKGIRLLSGTEPFLPQEYDCTLTPLNITGADPFGEGSIVLTSPRSSYSADLSLFAEGPEIVDVRTVENGARVWLSDLDDEFDDLKEAEFAWSPVDPTHMAVIECDYQGTDRCFSQRLFIVDVVSGEELASYPGDFMNMLWSPDGRRILYQDPEWQASERLSGPPCVLDIETGRNECIDEIPRTHFPKDLRTTYREVTNMRWIQRGYAFTYVYRAVYYEPNDQGTPGPLLDSGGLCRFDLATRNIDCPSEDAPELQGVWISDYDLSPDERFAYVLVSSEAVAHGVLNMENGSFFRLADPPGEDTYDASRFVNRLWRPQSLLSGLAEWVRSLSCHSVQVQPQRSRRT